MNQRDYDELLGEPAKNNLDEFRRLRLSLEQVLRVENARHRGIVASVEQSLEALQQACPHPVSSLSKHYGVFPEDTYTHCYICGAER
jgi:hypothetical protein